LSVLPRSPFGAIFQAEVLLNTKRVAPYALIILFSANAVLWWGWGPAIALGWATNSDYYIVRYLLGFSFIMGLPIFTAVIMGDPVARDVRLGVNPLIFSKPISRAEYLLGKFCGNFFVLVCCQIAFALTLLVLQAFRPAGMVVHTARVVPYFKHFFFFVVVSHLALAALYFTVGTLARDAKIVYGLSVCFYPLYIAHQALLLKGLPTRWRILLDPLLFNAGPGGSGFGQSADFLNRLVVSYSPDMMANRALMLLLAAGCLMVLYFRFSFVERPRKTEELSTLRLSTKAERLDDDPENFQAKINEQHEKTEPFMNVTLPGVTTVNEGFLVTLKKLFAALGVEFRLLRGERSLVVLLPLAIFFSVLDLAFYKVVPEVSYSGAYAAGTAQKLLLFLLGMSVFYTGEGLHRERELRVEPLLWSSPVPNSVLLLSKFFATLLVTSLLTALVGLTAVTVQIVKGETPIDLPTYLIIYSVILIPSTVFISGASLALNILLRDKYLAYAGSIALCAGLFYLYGIGYRHWLYNPVLYQLWTPGDLAGGGGSQLTRILVHRIYCLALTAFLLAVALLFFERKSKDGLKTRGHLGGTGRLILVMIVSALLAAIAGWVLSNQTWFLKTTGFYTPSICKTWHSFSHMLRLTLVNVSFAIRFGSLVP
jgi:ABC-type transport system involved in multi-copper enzyme maturation permease subunit